MTHLDVHTGGEVVTISADAAIDDAIRLLHEHHIRHLPVVRDGALVAIVSEGDILAGVGGHYSQDRVSTEDSTPASSAAIGTLPATLQVDRISSSMPIHVALFDVTGADLEGRTVRVGVEIGPSLAPSLPGKVSASR